MKGLVTSIKNWRNRRRQNALSNKLREIEKTFQVEERNGILYLMCDGVPYKALSQMLTAGEITELLSDARASMRNYFDIRNDGTTI